MRKSLVSLFLFCLSFGLSAQDWQPADPEATPEAKTLFERLQKIQAKGTMYGHQDDLVTGNTWWYEKDNYRSDTKEATGDYPALVGFELGEVELGSKYSLDSV